MRSNITHIRYIFSGVLLLVLLLVGGGAGFYLSQMNQDVRQQASMVYPDQCAQVGDCINGRTCTFINGQLQPQGATCSTPTGGTFSTGCFVTSDNCASQHPLNCEESNSFSTKAACQDSLGTGSSLKTCFFTNNSCNPGRIVSTNNCTTVGGWNSRTDCEANLGSTTTPPTPDDSNQNQDTNKVWLLVM